ncbi:hypothetical protein [Phenylobacterium sp.]|uniref:hypothetical protein n=1 Tax=Phenylobacterium sp. TaxID=1871053 RepID=UPI001202CB11|nr:hypothetical protein [Phenylobacterium sp.]THD61289.1 MAG: hypothetical protein E8A49_09795 [Phenylobacterium sp.]
MPQEIPPSVGHDPTERWYLRMMGAHRRGLIRFWPVTLIALATAVVLGLTSPDRSAPSPHHAPAQAGGLP